ncbi:prolyl-tRNA synthetase [Didymella exigua CBS 183.55]|uniref:proline--tRNA ligase n=1 Tax=Didymella exigua CBS 183.55 TaxID=1150837 RepID=A0A6A5RR96_9PLEO|nr:prolyl-tRNA synthetase [Didymella exigua CBS 183.55]KAF1930865.1 prolyl-tRNA synthetase [Didymella exigua CBS 183.55]
MVLQVLRTASRARVLSPLTWSSGGARCISTERRNRLSKFWTPTAGQNQQEGEQDESHALLVRGGYLRQAHSGVFHLLPLGLRVQNKLEALIDKHMESIGASKTSLSSITTEELWKQSGRYSANSELLRLKDRKDSGFLLSPTHEEEITSLVASMVHSYKDLPLRLYQTGRKYRDEKRPRQGLLRAKEFMMKDLYTFDSTVEAGLETYKSVRQAYKNLFEQLKLPYLVADADSGNMGGKLSHEYHFVSPKGEDNVWSCNTCPYVANEELVEKNSGPYEVGKLVSHPELNPLVFTGISVNRESKIQIRLPRPSNVAPDYQPPWSEISKYLNFHALKNMVQMLPDPNLDLDTGIETSALEKLLTETKYTNIILDRSVPTPMDCEHPSMPGSLDLTAVKEGDSCPRCETGELRVQKAIEVGHTFHLGTRYSEPLNAFVSVPSESKDTKWVPMQMGCHGIGVSRLIAAIASVLSTPSGLNWPRVVAPFEVAILPGPQAEAAEAVEVYDAITEKGSEVDAVLDDRPIKSLGWKLKDADLIGYPVVVVLGRGWKERREVEVQCRRLGVKTDVKLDELKGEVEGLLEQL